MELAPIGEAEESGNDKLNLSIKPNPMELAPIGEAEESGNDKLNLFDKPRAEGKRSFHYAEARKVAYEIRKT